MTFNQEEAQRHLDHQLKWYGIKVRKWRKTSSGCAHWKSKTIEIPKPTDPDRFGVCMHEIKHIIDGSRGTRFEQEFRCDKYAIDQMELLGFGGIEDWIMRMKWHCLSRIAMAHNRGLDHNKIGKEIREFFKAVDFSTWINKKVFVAMNKKEPEGYSIQLTNNLSKEEITMLLNRKGLMLSKSEMDDSTYGRWIVRGNGERFGSDFGNFAEIINHYQLSL